MKNRRLTIVFKRRDSLGGFKETSNEIIPSFRHLEGFLAQEDIVKIKYGLNEVYCNPTCSCCRQDRVRGLKQSIAIPFVVFKVG